MSGDPDDYLGFDGSLSLGDFDGDGALDIAMGSALFDNSRGGIVLVSNTDALSANGNVSGYQYRVILGADEEMWFSTMAQHQSDINGDGIDDLAIAGTDDLPGWNNGGDGAVSLFFDAGDPGTSDSADASILFTETNSSYGNTRVFTNGDFDGDGVNDVFVGDFRHSGGGWGGGGSQSNLFFHSGAGLSAGTYSVEDDATTNFYSDNYYDLLGSAVGGADINGDGLSELIIASPSYDYSSVNNGGCVFVLDYTMGLSGVDELEMITTIFNFSSQSAVICVDTEAARFGFGAEPQVADYNGDGEMDLALAAAGINKVFVFYTAANLSGVINAESEADVVITSGDNPQQFGFSLASGDFNGDGYDDLVIGAPDVQNPIYSGNDAGIVFSDDTLLASADANHAGVVYYYSGLNLWAANDHFDADATITSIDTDLFGMVLTAGDMNGDGKDDLWVGAPRYNGDEGRATLYLSP